MTKYEFERELKKGIKKLPREEAEKALEYYSEIFEDKIERGMGESEIIAEFGSPSEIAQKLLQDFLGDNIYADKEKKYTKDELAQMPTVNKVSGGRLAVFIVLSVFLGGVLIGLGITIWTCLIAIMISGGACALAGGVAIFPAIITQLGNLSVMLVQIAVCFITAGVGILLIVLSIKLIKVCAVLTKKMFIAFKRFLVVKKPIARV